MFLPGMYIHDDHSIRLFPTLLSPVFFHFPFSSLFLSSRSFFEFFLPGCVAALFPHPLLRMESDLQASQVFFLRERFLTPTVLFSHRPRFIPLCADL